MKALLLAALLTTDPASTDAGISGTPGTPAELAEVQGALDRFLRAFEALDWPAFRACFADGATVFHPAPPNALRTDGPDAFERAWRGVFERIRKTSGRTTPPFHQLDPSDVRIQLLSVDLALVTFHLRQEGSVGRRTVVLRRLAAGWKILHIHASNLPTSSAAARPGESPSPRAP